MIFTTLISLLSCLTICSSGADCTSTATEHKDPRDKIPGPDLAAFEPPAPEDLPEPIVIVAEDEEPGEEFHNEPKAASRDSGGASDGQAEIDEVLMELEADAKRQR